MNKFLSWALLCVSVLTTIVWGEEFSQTPKKETLAEAIQYEKNKDAAGAAQARKDAAEGAKTTRTSPANKKQGKADANKAAKK